MQLSTTGDRKTMSSMGSKVLEQCSANSTAAERALALLVASERLERANAELRNRIYRLEADMMQAKQGLMAALAGNESAYQRGYMDGQAKAIDAAMKPVAAQQRFRHGQKTTPDWSVWQPAPISNRPDWYIGSVGYETEYRLLYAAPQAKTPPRLTDAQLLTVALSYEALSRQLEGVDRWDYERSIETTVRLQFGIKE